MSESQVYVGIDVSKAELEVAVADEGWTVPNDESGVETLVEQLRERPVDLVVLEATGGYEMATAAALAEAGRSSPDLCVKAEEAPRLRLGCLGDLLFLEE